MKIDIYNYFILSLVCDNPLGIQSVGQKNFPTDYISFLSDALVKVFNCLLMKL